MTLVEAIRIIEERRDKVPVLSVELAAKMRVEVGANLEDSMSLRELYLAGHTNPQPSAGLDWKRFMLGLNPQEKKAITHSLGGLAFMFLDRRKYITVGDIRRADDLKTFAKYRGQIKSTFGLAFFKMAFERGVVEV